MSDVTLPLFCTAMAVIVFVDLGMRSPRIRVIRAMLLLAAGCYLLSRLFYAVPILAPIPPRAASILDLVAPAALILAVVVRALVQAREPEA